MTRPRSYADDAGDERFATDSVERRPKKTRGGEAPTARRDPRARADGWSRGDVEQAEARQGDDAADNHNASCPQLFFTPVSWCSPPVTPSAIRRRGSGEFHGSTVRLSAFSVHDHDGLPSLRQGGARRVVVHVGSCQRLFAFVTPTTLFGAITGNRVIVRWGPGVDGLRGPADPTGPRNDEGSGAQSRLSITQRPAMQVRKITSEGRRPES